MKFKDCKFRDKSSMRKHFKDDIMNGIKEELPVEKYNEGFLFEYIDLLLDETDFDVKRKQFYYKYNWVKINLSVSLLCKVAIDYIMEHQNDFLLEKNIKQ